MEVSCVIESCNCKAVMRYVVYPISSSCVYSKRAMIKTQRNAPFPHMYMTNAIDMPFENVERPDCSKRDGFD